MKEEKTNYKFTYSTTIHKTKKFEIYCMFISMVVQNNATFLSQNQNKLKKFGADLRFGSVHSMDILEEN